VHPAHTPGCGRRCSICTVLSVAIPIKIWNSARIEHRLQEQEKLLMASRLDALASQINPHFLFNTLTSISSLIRSQPETARTLIVKLSGLLRRLLRSQDTSSRCARSSRRSTSTSTSRASASGRSCRSRSTSIRPRST
jgi:two-component system LytT family sensor kinase